LTTTPTTGWMNEVNQTIIGWAEITIDRWEESIARYHIGDSRTLINSFLHYVITQSNGDVKMIQFAFEYYGKFVDMGVGRGRSLVNPDSRKYKALEKKGYNARNIARHLQGNRREPKPWYTPTLYREIHILTRLLATKYAEKCAITIVENIDDNALRWEKQHLHI
jgi:hypothetical protein